MHSRSLIELLEASGPFPTVSPVGKLRDGLAITQPPICRACTKHSCADQHTQAVELPFGATICYRGMGVLWAGGPTGAVVVNGVLTPALVQGLSRRDKKRLDAWRVEEVKVRSWLTQVSQLQDAFEAHLQDREGEALQAFHDVQTAVSTVLRNAEEFVQAQPGGSFDEKLDSLPRSGVNLVKSVQILNGRLRMLPILSNPDAARYGRKHPTPVYQVVDRLIRTMRQFAESKGVRLQLNGSSYNKPMGYDSFEAVPLVLLDNAIKYSQPGQSVEVAVNDVHQGVEVEVASFGPIIPEEERVRIFERGVRGASSDAVSSGQGLGLYIAAIVARANGFEIAVHSEPPKFNVGGLPFGTTTFRFTLRGTT